MKENEFSEMFNSLSDDEKKRLEQAIKLSMDFLPGTDKFKKMVGRHLELREILSKESDLSNVRKALFIEAESLERAQGSDDEKKVYNEYAREYDYIRHVAEEKGILYVRYAFNMTSITCRGNYEDAKILADNLKVRKEEAYGIIQYWKNELTSQS